MAGPCEPPMDHPFPFDPTYGYDLEALLAVRGPEPPADFAAFWRATWDQAMRTPPGPRLRHVGELAGEGGKVEVHEIDFAAWGGVRLGGWLTLPCQAEPTRAIVVGHGYGGREAPVADVPGPPAVALFPCARGLSRSARRDLPGHSARHVVHGIASRETYIHRGCAADIWAAASVLLELYPHLAGRLDYLGGSFGGGMGALALPWDDRFGRAALRVPSFGHHRLRVTLRCTGSGEAVRCHIAEHPDRDVLGVLAYFDAASAARFLTIPTLCECALFDPSVPPPGQFAVHNALAGEHELVVRQAGHFDYAEQAEDDETFARRADTWFRQWSEPHRQRV